MNQYLHTPLGYACRDCRGSNPAAERMRDLLLAREAKHGMEVALLHPISTSLSY